METNTVHGLQSAYREDDTIRIFCGKLDGLAFLSIDRLPEGMTILKEEMSEEMASVVDYFDATYVMGTYRSVMCNGVLRLRRTPPRFAPSTWNVHVATLKGGHRTNNVCESWNNGFRHLVGHKHPSVTTAIECQKEDCALVETDHLQHQHGILPAKRQRRNTINHQKKLKTLCQ